MKQRPARKRGAARRRKNGVRDGRVLDISLPRLFIYHRGLADALRDGVTVLTSQELASRVGRGISPTQVRKDLSALGNFGRRGHGYEVATLIRTLKGVLGLDRDWRLAIVGFGYLGPALASFLEFREEKFRIAAIFDNDRTLVGTRWHGVRISHVDNLEKVLPVVKCSIALIAVPAPVAQAVASRISACGIHAILNFAPVELRLPASVSVRSIDLASELSILTHHLA